MAVRFTSKEKRDNYLQSLKQPPVAVPSAKPQPQRATRRTKASGQKLPA
jgi:hypothetical protein